MKSIYDNTKFLQSLVPATRTTTTSGNAIDTRGFGSAALVVSAGAIFLGAADETYVFSVEESADGSTGWATIAGATASVLANNDVKLVRLEGLNVGTRKRYLRTTVTLAGTTPSIVCSALFALGRAYNEPVN